MPQRSRACLPRESGPTTLAALDLAALLCSRVCHDLISPVGAIVNGLEVLEEDKDEETKTFALDLIKKSAQQASAKLQFCRLALAQQVRPARRSISAMPKSVARGLIEDGKTTIAWNLPRELVAKNRVKLLLNMMVVAAGTIPRGGTLTVDRPRKWLPRRGGGPECPANRGDGRTGLRQGGHAVDAHAIQPVYTGILARDCGLTLSAATEGETVVVSAR